MLLGLGALDATGYSSAVVRPLAGGGVAERLGYAFIGTVPAAAGLVLALLRGGCSLTRSAA